jgi:uncharacterized SAM-binding protein YcdF (DUF218 family)
MVSRRVSASAAPDRLSAFIGNTTGVHDIAATSKEAIESFGVPAATILLQGRSDNTL